MLCPDNLARRILKDEHLARRDIQALSQDERLRLLELTLHACFPGDIRSMQKTLSRFTIRIDFVSQLPARPALAVLLALPLHECLRSQLVCKTWRDVFRTYEASIYEHHTRELTKHDPVPLTPPATEDGWKDLCKSLYFRESNWRLGLAQEIRFFSGHTSFVTCLKQHGDSLITGSYDETIRIWKISADTSSKRLQKTLPVQGSISCLDGLPQLGIVCAGCHDVGRVLLIDIRTGKTLHKLQGHNKGIKAIAVNDKFIISAGMDKALVVWNWETASKVVRFGQQTVPPIGVSFIDSIRFVSVQTDGIIRTFNIEERKLVGQFTPQDLLGNYDEMKPWLKSLGTNPTNVFMWLYAHIEYLSLCTRDFLLYFRWESQNNGIVDISKPPTLISYIRTNAKTNDLVTGVSDPAKQRAVTATRFAARSIPSSRRIFVGHFTRSLENTTDDPNEDNSNGETKEAELIPIGGAWEDEKAIPSMKDHNASYSNNGSSNTSRIKSSPTASTPNKKVSSPRQHTSRLSSSTPSPLTTRSFGTPNNSTTNFNTPRTTRSPSISTTASSSAQSTRTRSTVPRSTSRNTQSPSALSISSLSRSRSGTPVGTFQSPSVSASLARSSATPSRVKKDEQIPSVDSLISELANVTMNPMSMVCDHEKLVVGTTSGLVYLVSFVGHTYREKPHIQPQNENEELEEFPQAPSTSTPPRQGAPLPSSPVSPSPSPFVNSG